MSISPVQGGNISGSTGLYGCRRLSRDSIRRGRPSDPRCPPLHRWHAGIDIGKAEGSPVYAIGDGVVEYASNVNGSVELWPSGNPRQGYGGYGKVVLLKIGNWYVLYAHLASVEVRTGQQVREGQALGTVGRTRGSVSEPGRVFERGPHLHLEISSRRRIDQIGTGTVDPLTWLAESGVNVRQGRTGGYRIFHGELDPTHWEEPFTVNAEEAMAEAPTGPVDEWGRPLEAHERFWLYLTSPSALAEALGLAQLYSNAVDAMTAQIHMEPRIAALRAAMRIVQLVQITNTVTYTHLHMADFYGDVAGRRIHERDIDAMDELIKSSNEHLKSYLIAVARGQWALASQEILDALADSRDALDLLALASASVAGIVTRDIKDKLIEAAFEEAWEEWEDLYGYIPDFPLKPESPQVGFGIGLVVIAALGAGALYVWAASKGVGARAGRRRGTTLGGAIGRSISERSSVRKEAKTLFVKPTKTTTVKTRTRIKSPGVPIGGKRPSARRGRTVVRKPSRPVTVNGRVIGYK